MSEVLARAANFSKYKKKIREEKTHMCDHVTLWLADYNDAHKYTENIRRETVASRE